MTKDSFFLLSKLNQLGIGNESWGVIENVWSKSFFPVDSGHFLKGFHLWHWRKTDEAQIWPCNCYLTLDVNGADEKIDFYTLE